MLRPRRPRGPRKTCGGSQPRGHLTQVLNDRKESLATVESFVLLWLAILKSV